MWIHEFSSKELESYFSLWQDYYCRYERILIVQTMQTKEYSQNIKEEIKHETER